MRNNLLNSIRIGITLIAMVAFTGFANAALYTAVASGDWSSAATWGGTAPGTTITADQIVIPAGITVTLDNNIQLNGLTSSITVMGTLDSDAGLKLTATSGSIMGTGTISVDNLDLSTALTLGFTGTINADVVKTTATNLAVAADMNVSQSLNLAAGALSLNGGGSLVMGTGSDITLAGGKMLLNGGSIDLTNPYNVKYTTVGALAGLELSGSGLNNVLINTPAGTDVTLATNLDVDGSLSLLSGNLNLNSQDLTLNGAIAAGGSGYVKSTAASDIYLNSATGTTGTLAFEGTNNAVNNLYVKVGTNNTANISGGLTVMNQLDLNSGSLNFANASLTLNGTVTGTGTLSGSANSDLTINTAGGLTSPINFAATASTVDDLKINVGAGNAVTLGTDLTVYGDLNLQNQSKLNLASETLTFEDLGSMTGTGSLGVTATSGIVINSTNGMSNPLALSGTTLGSLTLNTASGADVKLNNDLTIATMLSLKNGTLDLNGQDLTISGNIAAGGTGAVATTDASNITINSATTTAGALHFAGESNAVNDLTLNMGANQKTYITGDLAVNGDLKLTSGVLSFNNATLTVNNAITGSGQLSGGTSANLVYNGSGTMNFATGGQVLQSLVFGANSNDTIVMGSNLTIDDTLNLSLNKMLWMGSHTLTIAQNGTIVGLGSLGGDSTSTLVVNSANGIDSEINYAGSSLGTLTLNSANAGTIYMGNDMIISKELNLMNGDMDLNGNNLTITGSMASGVNGTITSTDDSDITVKTKTTTGALAFSSWGNTVGNLKIDIANGGTQDIYTDVAIAETLNLVKGKVDIGNYEMWMDSSALIVGATTQSYIIADTAGYLSMHISKGGTASSVLFPIGTTASYAPVMLSLASSSNSGRIEANVVPGVYAEGTTGSDLSLKQPLVNMTWNLQSDTTIKNMNLTSAFMWNTASEVNGFDRTKAYASHYANGQWSKSTATSATSQGNSMYSMELKNITALSPFAVFGADAITDVHNIASDSKFTVYPNPAVGTLYINSASVSNDVITADIISVNGQVLKSKTVNNTTDAVSLDELNPGNYYIRISGKDTNEIKHFIKQ